MSELTSREQDVLGYVAAGISNLEISKCWAFPRER